mmetsp:Transcript_26152/g.57598  ORF Transcript_26152/g.57598 Transcript_26152/m.57598 type:complete len:211 (+) Transcript_26152:518-1150(+)
MDGACLPLPSISTPRGGCPGSVPTNCSVCLCLCGPRKKKKANNNHPLPWRLGLPPLPRFCRFAIASRKASFHAAPPIASRQDSSSLTVVGLLSRWWSSVGFCFAGNDDGGGDSGSSVPSAKTSIMRSRQGFPLASTSTRLVLHRLRTRFTDDSSLPINPTTMIGLFFPRGGGFVRDPAADRPRSSFPEEEPVRIVPVHPADLHALWIHLV